MHRWPSGFGLQRVSWSPDGQIDLLDPIAHAGPSGLRTESATRRGGHRRTLRSASVRLPAAPASRSSGSRMEHLWSRAGANGGN